MPIPFSDEVDVHPEVGAKPTTWYSGAAIGGTLWENVKTMRFFTDFIGHRPGNKSDTIWGILSADDGQGSAGKALIVDNTGAIANIQGIGINTTTPTERLHIVNGNIKTTGGNIEVAKDANDVISYFGKAAIGDVAFDDFAGFAHHDRAGIATDYALLQKNDGTTFINAGEDGNPKPIHFAVRAQTQMYIKSDGNVGIGTTSPGEKLEVNGNMKSLGVIYNSTSNTKEWWMAVVPNGNLHFAYHNGDGNWSDKGYLNFTVSVGAIDFTGQHRSKFEGNFTSELVGLIVESTGAYLELDGSVKPKIDEALPSVKLTTAAKSKRVYGVLSDIEGDTREYGSGFVTVLPKDDGITRVMVNSVGQGSLWVINTRDQALENGDYICSSSVAGYGEKQDDDILHSYTVAKITMSLDWSNLPDWLETRNVTASGEVSETGEYKAAFVGVTYHCG